MREPVFVSLPRPQPVPLGGRRVLVLGLGDTGLSVAKWVAHEGGRARVADTRAAPPQLAALRSAVPGAEMHTGAFAGKLLAGVDLMCVSPGLSLEEPVVREALARGMPIVGDIELFAWGLQTHGRGRVVAVTGTNGKTTVTSLTAHLLRGAGLDAEPAGNIGPPALAALAARVDAGRLPEVWTLELSSYQLETTWSLAPDAAVMLNLSEDHLDRYASLADYAAAKQRIFLGGTVQVLNRDDARSMAMADRGRQLITFGLSPAPREEDYGLVTLGGRKWIAQGANPLVACDALPIHGWHNVTNAMAAMALARAMGAASAPLIEATASFRGLPHRLEWIATVRGVDYYDDSKGTNVGATIAALRGLDRKLILIAGGVGKGQDFSALAQPVGQYVRRVQLIGQDAPSIEAAIAASGVPVERCRSLAQAVRAAARHARAGDAVLLSPACASFDMFRDYKERGEIFAALVRELARG